MRYWINTVARERVPEGVSAKDVRLKQLTKGDVVIFYSPKRDRKFVAIGTIANDGDRAVNLLRCDEASIHPLIDQLGFIRNKTSWGLPFRRGLFHVDESDGRTIAIAMNAVPETVTPVAARDIAATYS
jgi:hypothetical protein